MKQHISFLITIHFLSTTACTAMEEDSKIIKPRFCLFTFDDEAFVAGKNGWNVFDAASQQPCYDIKSDKIKDVAMNKDIIALTTKTSYDKPYRLCINSINAEGTKPEWVFESSSPITPIVVSNHTIIAYHKNKIKLYDYRDKTRDKCIIPYNTKATRISVIPLLISSHPTKLEFIYPSSDKTLSIVQPYHETLIKMELTTDFIQCDGGEYNPNGTILALKANYWQYFIYNIERNNSYAYEIGINSTPYVSSIFHPYLYILFLLSENNILEGWDYLRHILLFTTYPLANAMSAKMDYRTYNKRLAVSPDGTKLVVALEDTWKIIDIPHKNHLLSPDTSEFFQFNSTALSQVETLPPIRGGDLSKEAVMPTEYRKITAVYNKK
jgi:hypothetical protein